MKNLLLVESPAKAKTIGKYLGKDYEVMASFGHIRDLPSKDGSVEPDKDFVMHYQVSAKSIKHVAEIAKAAKNCKKLLLAPDPDREGEAIAWHILEVLKQKKAISPEVKIERIVFNSITKSSILEAIDRPRDIDIDLVNAQQARRALDYLVGFNISPVLWRKLPGSKSAGRVQSVSLRLICDREDEIESFKTQEYWDIKIDLTDLSTNPFKVTLSEVENKKLEKFSITNEAQAEKIKVELENKNYRVLSVNKKQAKRRPSPPFITSSLQQEAARKLNFSASKTMMIAQKLYEGIDIGSGVQGLITYMRTDSISMTPEAVDLARTVINHIYGADYLPKSPNIFKSKIKNAQEAHEAIRPTDFNLTSDIAAKHLERDHIALYDLIWKRAIASQMADVIFDQVVVEVETIPSYAKARAVGSTIRFDGFYRAYKEGIDDEKDDGENSLNIPKLEPDQDLKLIKVTPAQHFTEPPPRYSEASLVKKMEELGIGRPSTYATIISVLQDRGYVKIEKKRFIPEERGRIVTTFLKEFFAKYVEYGYTAELENDLDTISNGKMNWKNFLKIFWKDFNLNVSSVMDKSFTEVITVLNERFAPRILGLDEDGKIKDKCPSCSSGKLSFKLGKFGAFVGCSDYPECKYTMQIFGEESTGDQQQSPSFEPKLIGNDPVSGAKIMVKVGPYGPYLELDNSELESGSAAKDKGKKKPKRISIPKNMNLNDIDLQSAINLLSLPRKVGIHPETNLEIVANIGPFGAYILHDKRFFSLKQDDVMEVGLNRAIDIIASAPEKKPRAISKTVITKTKSKSTKSSSAKKPTKNK